MTRAAFYMKRSRPGARRAGTGGPVKSSWTYYHDGQLHPACPSNHVADEPMCLCVACRKCAICLRRKSEPERWYQSSTEATAAHRLDIQLRRGEIRSWRRAPKVILQEGPIATRITYRPDFEITELDGTVVMIEVKGARCACTKCQPTVPGHKRKHQAYAEDAMLKIKMYRGHPDLPPLRVIDAQGRPIHV